MKGDNTRRAHRADWDALGRIDPFYAILSGDDKKFGGWDVDTFLATGAHDAELLLSAGDRLGVPARRGRALELGCGAGRVGRHVAAAFDDYVGLDISPTMIALAKDLNSGIANAQWQVASGVDLAGCPSDAFDVVYSGLVLQHCPTREIIRSLIAEMTRVLRPGGLAVFQLPASMPVRHRIQLKRRLYRALRALGLSDETVYRRLKLHPIRMNWLPREAVEQVITAAGGSLLEVHHGWLGSGGSAGGETNLCYVVTKSGRAVRSPVPGGASGSR